MMASKYKRLHPMGRLFCMIGLGICIGSTTPSIVEGIAAGIGFITIGWIIQATTHGT